MTQLLHFQRAAKLFEQQYLCTLSLADLSGKLPPELFPSLHTHLFCMESKRGNADICARFERGEILRLIEKTREPFWKKCPMGCMEAVFPLFREKELLGVLFAGPYGKNHLPELPENEESFFVYGTLLADMLCCLAQSPANELDLILEKHLSDPDFALSFLAKQWRITLPRASEKVKRISGKSFVRLLREKRIAYGCRLLTQTFFSIEQIAEKCGFPEPSYFYRVFRSVRKITPESYRENFWIKSDRS